MPASSSQRRGGRPPAVGSHRRPRRLDRGCGLPRGLPLRSLTCPLLRDDRLVGRGPVVGIAVVGICLRGGDSPVDGTDQRREALALLGRRPPVDAQLVAGRVDVDLLGGQLLPGLTQHRHEERSGAQEPPDADRRRVERRVGAALDDHPGEHRQRGGQHEHEHEAHDETGHLGDPPQETARRPTDALRALRLRPGHGQRTL
ncbi:hypothetical protein B277_01554 [Janibacter hoylei PVAS-1]|uniref:Uncharacterized protein n=1 Tax=Janibacter hoylei PVAS-1 TaxID=1210046 RepID=K1EAQ8_9MICO|nr:hypothetical protein B277_01554 [Janibacter hoylei PVAS-1]